MFHFLSKFLPILVYPLGLACIVLVVILVINRESPWTKRLSLIAFLLLFTGGNGFVSNGILYSLENQAPH